jgi:hypothetical protein
MAAATRGTAVTVEGMIQTLESAHGRWQDHLGTV